MRHTNCTTSTTANTKKKQQTQQTAHKSHSIIITHQTHKFGKTKSIMVLQLGKTKKMIRVPELGKTNSTIYDLRKKFCWNCWNCCCSNDLMELLLLKLRLGICGCWKEKRRKEIFFCCEKIKVWKMWNRSRNFNEEVEDKEKI